MGVGMTERVWPANPVHSNLTRTIPTTDFQSFRTAVLESDDLQEQVISIINTATANGSGMGDGIATLAKNRGYTITSEEVYAHHALHRQRGR